MIGSALSSTFHGRDVFSPAAAHLARGDDWTQVGPEIRALVRLKIPAARSDAKGISGEVLALDEPFGSLISNIGAEEFRKLGYSLGDRVRVILDHRGVLVPYVKTFSDVPIGAPLLYIDSRGRIGLAVNRGSFSRNYKVSPPLPIFIPRKRGARVRHHRGGKPLHQIDGMNRLVHQRPAAVEFELSLPAPR